METKDSKTTNASITNKVRPLLTVERSSSEEGDNNLSEVTLTVSQHDLDTPKEAYSIGIRVDPEDLLEDEENNVAPPGEHGECPVQQVPALVTVVVAYKWNLC